MSYCAYCHKRLDPKVWTSMMVFGKHLKFCVDDNCWKNFKATEFHK